MRTLALSGLVLVAACGDDAPNKDAEVAAETVDGEVAETAQTDAVEDVDAAQEADAAEEADTSAETDASEEVDSGPDIPPDATPEQRALLEVPETSRVALKNLSGPVQVLRSANSMPHIYAANREDLGRVLGYVQSQDRFFFMDLQRRLALGKVGELLGDVGLSSDIESRNTGMAYVTDRIVANLSPEFAAYLTAYADGVNQYIDAVRAGSALAPSETQYAGLLGYASPADMMKPFALRDVIALAVVFMYSTNFESGDPGQQAAADRLPQQFDGATDEALRKSGYLGDMWNDVRAMFPGTNSTEGFGIGKATPRRAAAAKPPTPSAAVTAMAQDLFERLHARALRLGKDREAGFGSNMWAVSGAKTADGSALFANDGHLELSVPPLGYGAALDTRVFGGGDIHLLGGWLGSFPVMMAGTNGSVAWGGVNPVEDITDWYRERLQLGADGKPAQSYFQGVWRDLVATEEAYIVADVALLESVGRTETWAHYATFDGRWITSVEGRTVASIDDAGADRDKVINVMGTLVVPGDQDGDGEVAALSFDFTALDATKWPEALFAVGFATSVEEVHEATRGYVGSALFTSAADTSGSILFSSYQAIPCRGYLPRGEDNVFLPGADPTRLIDGTEYGGFTIPTDAAGKTDEGPGQDDPYKCIVPFTQMPYAIDPPSGFIFSANSDPAGLTDDGEERNDAYHIGGPWASVRANTIRRDLLEHTADGAATLEDMKAMQANVDSRLGEAFVPYLSQALERAQAMSGPLGALYAEHGARLTEAVTRLEGWGARGFQARSGVETFYSSPAQNDRDDAVATMIFNAYIRRFFAAVWDDEGITAQRWGSESRPTALLRFLAGRGPDNPGGLASWNPDTGESVFFDVLGTEAKESSDELMVKALIDALAFLESPPGDQQPSLGGFGTPDMDAWLWGLKHQAKFESILASYVGNDPALSLLTEQFAITTDRLPLMPNLPAGDPRAALKWFPRGGDQWGVDAANPGIGGGDFSFGSGPAMRLVFRLKDGAVEGGFALPGGQSALTDSPYFDDQAKLWLANDYFELHFEPVAAAANAVGRDLFVPADVASQ